MAKSPANTSSRATKQSPMQTILALAERLGNYREKFGYQKAKAEGLERMIDLNARVGALESASKHVPPIQPNSQEGLMAQNDNHSTAQPSRMDRIKNGWRITKKYSPFAALLLIGVGVYFIISSLLPSDKKDIAQKPPATEGVLTKSDMEKFVKDTVKTEMTSFEDRFGSKLDKAVADLKKSLPVAAPETSSKPSTPSAFFFADWDSYNGAERLGVMIEQCSKGKGWAEDRDQKKLKADLAATSKLDASKLIVSCNPDDLGKKPLVSAAPADARAEVAPPARTSNAPVASTPVADEDDQEVADDRGARVQQANYYPGRQNFGSMRRGGGTPNCPPSFRFDPRERSCVRHMEVSGPSPYNVPDHVARCKPGSTRTITVTSPTGGRRLVHQTCNVHR